MELSIGWTVVVISKRPKRFVNVAVLQLRPVKNAFVNQSAKESAVAMMVVKANVRILVARTAI
jgi:hypothetical protein